MKNGRYRMYLIGFDPPELDMEGDTVTAEYHILPGHPDASGLPLGTTLRVVDTEHFGKVVWVEVVRN